MSLRCPVCDGELHGVEPRRGGWREPWKEPQVSLVRRLAGLGMRHKCIGKVLGTSDFAIRRLLRRVRVGRWL